MDGGCVEICVVLGAKVADRDASGNWPEEARVLVVTIIRIRCSASASALTSQTFICSYLFYDFKSESIPITSPPTTP